MWPGSQPYGINIKEQFNVVLTRNLAPVKEYAAISQERISNHFHSMPGTLQHIIDLRGGKIPYYLLILLMHSM